MRTRRVGAFTVALLLSAVSLVASPAPATAVTDADIAAARDRLIGAQRRAEQAQQRLAGLQRDLDDANRRRNAADAELARVTAERDRVAVVVRDRAVEIYKQGGDDLAMASLLTLGDLSKAARGNVYLTAAMSKDARQMRGLGALSDDVATQRDELAKAQAQLRDANRRAEVEKRQIDASLTQARDAQVQLERQKAAEDARRRAAAERALAEAAAQRRAAQAAPPGRTRRNEAIGGRAAVAATDAAPAPPTGGSSLPPGSKACPVAGPVTFSDTWGAPRSGGRRHQGVDMMGAMGTPLAAITDGVVTRAGNSGLGGITLWLRDDNGNLYYYAHNRSNAVGPGTRVRAGQIIAYLGMTGNARYTAPHLHFEFRPGGRGPVNPTPLVRSVC